MGIETGVMTMKNHCKANPCCSDPYNCKIPLPQFKSGYPHLNTKEECEERAYDLADSLSDLYGCNSDIRKRLEVMFLEAINFGMEFQKGLGK